MDRIANFEIIYERWSREAMICEDLNELYNDDSLSIDLKSSGDSQ